MNPALSVFRGASLTRFLEELDSGKFVWVVKRLSGNDTGLTGGHQSGVYFPRAFFEETMPEICTTHDCNPKMVFEDVYFPSQNAELKGVTGTYYNNKFFPERGNSKAYDEFRLTCWGGKNSPVQDPENTGSIFIFGVGRCGGGGVVGVGWVAVTLEEEKLIEEWLCQEVEPGRHIMSGLSPVLNPLNIDLPPEWSVQFPSGSEIFEFVRSKIPHMQGAGSIDRLLIKRREFEFSIFERLEANDVLPTVSRGFKNVGEFVRYANGVANRRKSRSGASLELNLKAVFDDVGVLCERHVVTELRKQPDFVFPSGKAYHEPTFPSNMLTMLASKTCCKDRWRQVINEADRITPKHLFTLQEGVSGSQIREMLKHNIELGV